jgi:ribonuclease HI
VKNALLELLNRVWRNGVFPASWRTGIIVPIPKPNSSESGPAAFRPITLTNCIAKLFERIVNRRLTTELESNGRLDKRQHAFRAGRGVDTYLAELDRSLPNTDEHCLIASLDLSKAYDTTWRFGILRTLRKWQIGGRMFNVLNSFLADRTFRVNVEGHFSKEMPLENGVPQGSVLSVTLFLVAMQPIFRVVPHTVTVLLYADDILLVVRRSKGQPLHRTLQAAVRAVDKWAKSVGFKISAAKSNIFYCSPNARREPSKDIYIDQVAVPKTNRLKVIGVTLDRTLTFKQHCKLVKTSCDSRLRIIKMIGAKIPRGQRNSLLRIGSAIVTSRLFYGIGLVSRAKDSVIQTLAPVYNRMVRFASGAYVTSPIPALMAEAGTLPFDLLTLQTILRVAIRMMEKDSRNVDLPVVQRASDRLMEVAGVPFPNIAVRTRLANRTWYEPKPRVVWDVKRQVKAGAPTEKVRPIVRELLSNRFNRATVVYTDGSKCDDTVGSGVFSDNVQRSIGLPSNCSVFSAEAFAIKSALNVSASNELLIMSDSASCLAAIESGKSKHPWIQQIEDLLRNRTVHLCWIPGHVGIHGNEEADRLAGEARSHLPLNVGLPRKDAAKAMSQAIRQQWEERWALSTEVKLREVKADTKKWSDRDNSADQRVLTRLRIGHTRLTHEFLLKKSSPPVCDCCGTVVDVRHIILQCRKFAAARTTYGIDPTSLHAALCNDDDCEKRLLKFLKEANVYSRL